MSSATQSDTVRTLPIRDNTMNRKHILEEVNRINVELANDKYGYDQSVILHTLKRKRNEEGAITFRNSPFFDWPEKLNDVIERIVNVPVELEPSFITKEDYNGLMLTTSNRADWEMVMRQVFGYGKNKEDTVYDVLQHFHNVVEKCAKYKLEDIKQTREEYDKSVEMRHFWCQPLRTLEIQQGKEIQKVSKDVVLSHREIQRLNKYVIEDQQDCFIVQACETMKYMLNSVVNDIGIRSVKSAFERVTKERNTTIDDDLSTDQERD